MASGRPCKDVHLSEYIPGPVKVYHWEPVCQSEGEVHRNRTVMHRPTPRGSDFRSTGRLPGRNCHIFRSARGSCGSYHSSPSSHLGIHSSSPHGLSTLPLRRPHSQAGPAASYQRARQATRSRKPAARPRCLFRASLRFFWQWRNRMVGELACTSLFRAQTMCDSQDKHGSSRA